MMLRCVAALCCLSAAAALQVPAPHAKSTRRAVLGALPLVALPLSALADDAVLHVLDYPKQGLCGEALVPEKGVPFVKAFGGMSDGSCASAGYPNKEGTANGTGDKDSDREYDLYSK